MSQMVLLKRLLSMYDKLRHGHVIPIAAYMVTMALLWLAMPSSNDFSKGLLSSLAQWDSYIYLDIADRGYHLKPCAYGDAAAPRWCGNTGWFPGYALLVRGLFFLGLPMVSAGVAVSAVASMLLIAMFWHYVLKHERPELALTSLLILCFFPGSIFLHGVFPISLALCFNLMAIVMFDRQRYLLSGVWGFLGAMTYTSGVVLGAAMIWGLVCRWRRREIGVRTFLGFAFQSAGLCGLGFLSVMLWHGLATGYVDGFFKIQGQYGHGMHQPLAVFWQNLVSGLSSDHEAALVVSRQAAVVGMFALGTMLFVIRHAVLKQDRASQPLEQLLLAYLVLYWLLPLSAGPGISIYRADAMLLPAGLLVRFWPRYLRLLLIAVFVYLAWSMSKLYLAGKLV